MGRPKGSKNKSKTIGKPAVLAQLSDDSEAEDLEQAGPPKPARRESASTGRKQLQDDGESEEDELAEEIGAPKSFL